MTAGSGPEGEKAGLSRPRAARPEGLALRPGRPRVQRPDACAAPETKGEPAWLGPGDPGGEISAPGGVPGCAPPANRSRQTEEKCLSERTVERDFHNPAAAAATWVSRARGAEGGPVLLRSRRAWIRKGGLPFLTADLQRTAAMDRALRIDLKSQYPTRCVERIAVLAGRLGTGVQGANHVRRSGSGERDKTMRNVLQSAGEAVPADPDLSIGRKGQRVERAPGNPGLVSFASPRTVRHSYARQGL